MRGRIYSAFLIYVADWQQKHYHGQGIQKMTTPVIAHRSENGQPINGPTLVGNSDSFASTHYLANVPSKCCITLPSCKSKVAQGSNVVPNSHPFRSKSIDPSIPDIWLFKNLILKIQSKVMGMVKGQGHSEYENLSTHISFLFHVNQPSHSCDTADLQFDFGSPRSRS